MSHISPKQLDEALAGDLDALRLVITHLESGCEACESLLDGVDIDTLGLLVEASEAGAVQPTAAEWAQIRPQHRPSGMGRLRWLAPALAIAAALFLVVRATLPTAPVDGIKGGELARPQVGLQVLVGTVGQGGFELHRRLDDGDLLGPEVTLIFEVDSSTASARYVFVVNERGEATVLYPVDEPAIEAAGRRRIAVGADLVAFALDDWSGPITVVGASASGAPSSADIVDGFASRREVPGVSYASRSGVVAP